MKDKLPQTKGKLLFGVDLKKYTRLGVGGAAEIMFFPKDIDDLRFFVQNVSDDMPCFILGGGSNLLVRDGGIKGAVIKLNTPYFRKAVANGDKITCFAGYQNANFKKFLPQHSLGGLEFLASIPGTIGGLVKTNAGCFGKALSDVLISAQVMDGEGHIFEPKPSDFHFSYRKSDFPKDWIVLSLTLQAQKDLPEHIIQIIEEHRAYREARQPCYERTAGSTFKNPEGLRAWELIKNAGCADLKIGDAKLSEKHCNFMINSGHATAADFENLGDEIVRRVKEKTGVVLDWEVEKVGLKK